MSHQPDPSLAPQVVDLIADRERRDEAHLARLERDDLWCAHYCALMELATKLDPLSRMVAGWLSARMDALAQGGAL